LQAKAVRPETQRAVRHVPDGHRRGRPALIETPRRSYLRRMTLLLRLGAACGIACGVLIAVPAAVEAFTGETAPTSFLLGVSPAFGVPMLTATYLRQSQAAGRFGAIAYVVNLIGLGLFGGAAFTLNMVLFYLDRPVLVELMRGPTRLALLGSAVVFVAGTVMFAVSMARARVYPRALAWAYGLPLALFAVLAPLPDTPPISALHVLVGASLVWLSGAVWSAPVIPAARDHAPRSRVAL